MAGWGGIWEPNGEAAGRASVLSIVFLIIAPNTEHARSMQRSTRVGTNRAQVKCNHRWQEEKKKETKTKEGNTKRDQTPEKTTQMLSWRNQRTYKK